MKENYQYGDTDGNNGWYIDEFDPAELEALWEIKDHMRPIMWGSERRSKLRVRIGYEGDPYIGNIALNKDKERIVKAITERAEEIRKSGHISPPSVEEIKAYYYNK